MLKVKTFNNGIIKIEEDGSVHILSVSSCYDIEWSLKQYAAVVSIVEKFQGEKLEDKELR